MLDARADLPPEAVVGQALHSGILTRLAVEQECAVKVRALIEREGEYGGRIGEQGEVHDTDGVFGVEADVGVGAGAGEDAVESTPEPNGSCEASMKCNRGRRGDGQARYAVQRAEPARHRHQGLGRAVRGVQAGDTREGGGRTEEGVEAAYTCGFTTDDGPSHC